MDIDLTVNARGQIEVEVNTRSIWYDLMNIQFWCFNLCMCLCQSPSTWTGYVASAVCYK